MKILIVDDEIKIREVIKEYCINEGFITEEANDGIEALEKIKNGEFDILILDIMMPHMDGFTCFEEIRKTCNIPTIVLSARTEEYDKLHGFQLGIDDYLTKPFSPKELMARIKAIVKRTKKVEKEILTYKGIIMDIKAHTVTIDQKEINLTPKEYDLLTLFLKNKNVAISREQLLSKIWGYDFYGDDRTIDTHIKMLRNNLGPYRDHIYTVRGIGYKFVSDTDEEE